MSKTNNASNSGIITVSGQLTSAQIKALHATPINLIPAPSNSQVIQVLSMFSSFVYGGNNVFTAAAAQVVAVFYSTGTTFSLVTSVNNTAIKASANSFNISNPSVGTYPATSLAAGQPITAYNSVATEISGNAANDNVINWTINYQIVNT